MTKNLFDAAYHKAMVEARLAAGFSETEIELMN